jgi:hypothetical protein
LKLDALDHPKTFDFAGRLEVSRPTAIGHLELFWHFVAKHAPRGNIGKFPNTSIARACDWTGDPEAFLQALLKSALIDASEEHRFLVHDWPEHCPNWVRAQLQKLKTPFFSITIATEEPSSVPSTRAGVSKPSHTKPSHTKPSVGAGERETEEAGSAGLGPDGVVEHIRAHYPAGHYRDSAWMKAAHFVSLRLEEGVEAHELVDAAAKYCDQQRARGKVGTEFILSPAKFFEASDWRGPFPMPPSKAELRQDENLAASQTWLENSNAGS